MLLQPISLSHLFITGTAASIIWDHFIHIFGIYIQDTFSHGVRQFSGNYIYHLVVPKLLFLYSFFGLYVQRKWRKIWVQWYESTIYHLKGSKISYWNSGRRDIELRTKERWFLVFSTIYSCSKKKQNDTYFLDNPQRAFLNYILMHVAKETWRIIK